MLQLHIEKGQLFYNGQKTQLQELSLSGKVKEVFAYMLHNDIDIIFEKHAQRVSFSPLRTDLKTKLLNALMAERLVRHHAL